MMITLKKLFNEHSEKVFKLDDGLFGEIIERGPWDDEFNEGTFVVKTTDGKKRILPESLEVVLVEF